MSADTLTADGAAVDIGPPAADENGHSSIFLGYAAEPGSDEIVTLTASGYSAQYNGASVEITATGYDLSGDVTFRTVLWDNNAANPVGAYAPTMSLLANGNVAVAWLNVDGLSQAGDQHDQYAVVSPSGTVLISYLLNSTPPGGHTAPVYPINGDPALYATATGFDMAWNAETSPYAGPQSYARELQTFDMSGQLVQGSSTPASGWDIHAPTSPPHAFAAGAAGSLQVTDNTVQYYDGTSLHAAAAIPDTPAGVITDEAAAMLANGDAAVAWVVSATDYVSIFDPATNSFGPVIGLDWGGASDVHVVGLPDGGFAVSWMNGGAYKGELFDSAGNGGGVLSLTGDFAGIASNGDLYTVGLNSSGQYVVQDYAINGAGGGSSGGSSGGTTGGGSGSTVYTSDAYYTAPDGVSTIHLTGSNQTIQANNGGDTIWSDNSQNDLVGGTGNDTFHLGRGGDTAWSGGGNDTFSFAEVPWAGGHINGFASGDVLDLSGLISTTGDTGSNALADGYLQLVSDGNGGTDVMARYATSGDNSNWWLVTDVTKVDPGALQFSGGAFTMNPAPSSSVSTSDANYTAPSYVTSITLTGSGQTVHAGNHDTTIYSDNGANTLYGGTGDDTIHIGRDGDTVYGGPGRDVFVFDDIPWASATIKDFDVSQGDSINVSGILARAGYTGADPIGDGYLKLVDSSGVDQVWANYNQPGNNGWWLVATVEDRTSYGNPVGPLQYLGNGVIDVSVEHLGGTYTTATGGSFGGYDTIVMTGSNGSVWANDGGDTVIDQGSNNTVGDGRGNDTLILSPTTKQVDVGAMGGLDTIVLNAHPTVAAGDPYDLTAGDRIDLHPLLQGMGYTGSDPIADGYVQVYRAPQGAALYPSALQIQVDSDGPGGSATWTTVFEADGRTGNPHYKDGYLLF